MRRGIFGALVLFALGCGAPTATAPGPDASPADTSADSAVGSGDAAADSAEPDPSDAAAPSDGAAATDSAGTTDAAAGSDAATGDGDSTATDDSNDSDVPANGTACDDGDECTVDDVWQNGVCGGDNVCACKASSDCPDDGNVCNGKLFCDKSSFPYVCKTNPVSVIDCGPASGPCQEPPVCNPASGQCSPKAKPDLTPCDDGNTCTSGDTCAAGSCTSGTNTCLCTTDQDCAGKDDGDLCNGTLFCNKASGACVLNPATIVVCPTAADTDCQKNTCQPLTGQCLPIAAPNATSCDDANPCTTGETCQQGVCSGGADTCLCTQDSDCSDDGNACNGTPFCNLQTGKCQLNPATVVSCPGTNNPCTSNTCDPVSGACVLANAATGTACSDGVSCTAGDGCVDGACAAGTNTCNCQNDGDCAGLGNPCTGLWFCSPGLGKCVRNPATVLVCANAADGPCTTTSCDPQAGKCATKNLANGTPCTDGNPCTSGEACLAGACTGQLATDICPCLADADCAKFEDGDLCNGVLYCDKSGASPECKPNPATVKTCPTVDNGPCAVLACVPQTGLCATKWAADGAVCSDGNACAFPGECDSGVCAPGAPVDCDDGNPCTTDACGASGCYHANVSGPCTDDAPCAVDKSCSAGQCVGGSAALWDIALGGTAASGARVAAGPDAGMLIAVSRSGPVVPEVVVRRYSAGGEQVWQKVLTADTGVSVKATLWSGEAWWLALDVAGVAAEPAKIRLVRILPAGTVVDTLDLAEAGAACGATGLVLTGSGDLVVAGWVDEPVGSAVQRQGYAARVTVAGQTLWTARWGGGLADSAVGVASAAAGLVVVSDADRTPDGAQGKAEVRVLDAASGAVGPPTALPGIDRPAGLAQTALGMWAVGARAVGTGLHLVPLSAAAVPLAGHQLDADGLLAIRDVAAAADGGLLLTLQVSNGDVRGELVRTDANGWEQWRQPFAPGADDALAAAAELQDGSVGLAGLRDLQDGAGWTRVLRWSAFGHATCGAAGNCAGKELLDCLAPAACSVPVCNVGVCTTAPRDCGSDSLCATQVCDPIAGCKATLLSGSCNDDNSCTNKDTCVAGVCIGTMKVCDDKNQCTLDYCGSTGSCVYTPLDGAACDDGDLCTTDTCAGSTCAGVPITCPDGADACQTMGFCKPAEGCLLAPPLGNQSPAVGEPTQWQAVRRVEGSTDLLVGGTLQTAPSPNVIVARYWRDGGARWSFAPTTVIGSLLGMTERNGKVIAVSTDFKYQVVDVATGKHVTAGSIFKFGTPVLRPGAGFGDADGVHFCYWDNTFGKLECRTVTEDGVTTVTGVPTAGGNFGGFDLHAMHKSGTQWMVGLQSGAQSVATSFDTTGGSATNMGPGLATLQYTPTLTSILRIGSAKILAGHALVTETQKTSGFVTVSSSSAATTLVLQCQESTIWSVVPGPSAQSLIAVGACAQTVGGALRPWRARIDFSTDGKAWVQWTETGSTATDTELRAVAPDGASRWVAVGDTNTGGSFAPLWQTFDHWGRQGCNYGACYVKDFASCDDSNPCTVETCSGVGVCASGNSKPGCTP